MKEGRGPTVPDMGESDLLPVYRRPSTLFVRGKGVTLEDEEGRRYLDFTSGIGVNALGHGSLTVRRAIQNALESGLVHTSNLFRTAPAERLAELLVAHSIPGRAFFCNSGAEAVEGALKFARRRARTIGGPEKHEIVALRGSFHGRLFGSLAITDRPALREPFEPLMPGVRFVEPEDGEGLERVVTARRTAAIVAEPVQGEGGIHPLSEGYLRHLRDVAHRAEASLVFDEIQCGLGRTGRLFAFEHAGVEPDLLVLAKPLAGGLPMGAVIVGEKVAGAIQPGDHATTFGGGPLVATVAVAVVSEVARPAFLEGVRRRGDRVREHLEGLRAASDAVRAIRGRGLIWGLELDEPVAPLVEEARRRGLLLVPAGARTLRLLPPLQIEDAELERGLAIVAESLP